MTGVEWGLPVVAKYWIGGVSAGAFFTFFLWQGLQIQRFKPVARLAWISSAVFAVAIPLPILSHLGQPGRFLNVLTDFHWSSPMSWAGPILIAYVLVVLLNGRFFFFEDVVMAYRSATGFRKLAYRFLIVTKPPEGDIPKSSDLVVKVTGALGLLLVLSFVYTGFELGVTGSRPIWANPLNPLMFLVSGFFSGMAFVALLWGLIDPLAKGEPGANGTAFMRSLMLPSLVALFLAMNVVGFITLAYQSPEVRSSVEVLATGELSLLFLWVGIVVCALVPAVMLTLNSFLRTPSRLVLVVSCALIFVGSFAQKYGFVVGGQLTGPGSAGVTPWPTGAEVFEFVAILALLYVLLQIGLWLSPWRWGPEPGPQAPASGEVVVRT